MKTLLQKIKNHERNWFETLVIWVILISSITIGFETDPEVHARFFNFFHYFELTVVLFFSLEIIINIYANSPNPLNYFKNGWNLFDFIIVIASIIPLILHYSDNTTNAILILRVFRLARVFRVVHVIGHFKPLKDLVETLVKSLTAMAYVSLLMLILFYVYAVIGVIMFGSTDNANFGNISITFLTLFQIVTGENWPDLLRSQMNGSDSQPVFAVIYFVSFILIGSMVILNLFIGIIVNRMNTVAQNNHNNRKKTEREELVSSIELKLEEINNLVIKLKNDNSVK